MSALQEKQIVTIGGATYTLMVRRAKTKRRGKARQRERRSVGKDRPKFVSFSNYRIFVENQREFGTIGPNDPLTCYYQHCEDREIKEGDNVISRGHGRIYHEKCWEKCHV